MASYTGNLNLKKPALDDDALITDINNNMDILDAAANGIQDALAIVANGNTHVAISAGQFVYVRNHTTLTEGLYVASSNIAANATLSTSNLTADSAGGLNALNSKLPKVYNSYKFCSGTEGSLTLNVPVGKYVVQAIGKTQTSDKFINMSIDGASASTFGYLGALIGTNTGSRVITASTSLVKTYDVDSTITLSYSENWYSAQLIATLVQ